LETYQAPKNLPYLDHISNFGKQALAGFFLPYPAPFPPKQCEFPSPQVARSDVQIISAIFQGELITKGTGKLSSIFSGHARQS
jgi:hypothetical protein